jgi:hypothetical protein
MKPTFDICFSAEHPNRPGLWIQRRGNFIGVLDVQQSDIERDAREGNWLDGEWGAEIKLAGRDVVPLQRKLVQEHIDGLLKQHHETYLKTTGEGCDTDARTRAQTAIDALQSLRLDLLGEKMVLPEDDSA